MLTRVCKAHAASTFWGSCLVGSIFELGILLQLIQIRKWKLGLVLIAYTCLNKDLHHKGQISRTGCFNKESVKEVSVDL